MHTLLPAVPRQQFTSVDGYRSIHPQTGSAAPQIGTKHIEWFAKGHSPAESRLPEPGTREGANMSRQETIAALARFKDFDINEDDDLEIAHQVIASFGIVRREAEAHRRAVRFLHACLSPYLWTWEALNCDPPGPASAAAAVADWLQTHEFHDTFAELCVPVAPVCNGQPVQDCDEPALTDLAGAAARLAYFCLTRHPTDAALVLISLFWADAEGLQSSDNVPFADWVTSTALAAAWPDPKTTT